MIKTERGNIWDYRKTHLIVIPTNIGWRANGMNVMGRGLAKQAAERYPMLDMWYGEKCRENGEYTPVLLYPDSPLLLFPVKPLNLDAPNLSWMSKASLDLIARSARQLMTFPTTKPVAMSLVGCGNGGLEMSEVRPILDKYLSNDRFTLVLLNGITES